MQTIRLNIQSFGDIITNSSSEVYCMYDEYGVKQIKKAIQEIVACLNPSINLEEHLKIELVPKDYILDEWRDKQEVYTNESNEELLQNLPRKFKEWLDKKEAYSDAPIYELEITDLTAIGKVLRKNIMEILYAFDYQVIYD